jgi:hypothetical protein
VTFDQLKAATSAPRVKNLRQEDTKLHTLRTLGVCMQSFGVLSFKVRQTSNPCATYEHAGELQNGLMLMNLKLSKHKTPLGAIMLRNLRLNSPDRR